MFVTPASIIFHVNWSKEYSLLIPENRKVAASASNSISPAIFFMVIVPLVILMSPLPFRLSLRLLGCHPYLSEGQKYHNRYAFSSVVIVFVLHNHIPGPESTLILWRSFLSTCLLTIIRLWRIQTNGHSKLLPCAGRTHALLLSPSRPRYRGVGLW